MVEKRKVLVALAKFFIPIVIGIGFLAILGFSLDNKTWMKLWPLLTAYFFPPFGKETVIPIGVYGGELTVPIINKHIIVNPIDPLLMALSIAFIDSVVSLFVVWNYDLTKKIPLLGRFIIKIEKLERKGSKKYKWIKPLRFIGIVLFVMIPFQGSGGLVGSILGRLMGMKPLTTWSAVTTGAVIGCILIAYFANFLKSILLKNVILGLAIIILLIITAVIYRIARANSNQNIPSRK